jgi:hypothetical protein
MRARWGFVRQPVSMVAPPESPRCPTCGAPTRALLGLGGFASFDEHHVPELSHLFAGGFDRIRCDVAKCGADLGVSPTVFVRFSDPPEGLLVVGSGALGRHEEVQEGLVRRARAEGTAMPVREFESFDSLRRAVAARLRTRQETMNTAIEAVHGGWIDHIAEHWRDLTARVFAAQWLGYIAPIPGVAIAVSPGRANPPPNATILDFLARVQATVWVVLIDAWWQKRRRGPGLEADLREFIHPKVILPSAPGHLDEALEPITRSPDARQRYVAEVVRASVWNAHGVENPRAREWAELFFAFELDRRGAHPEFRDEMEELSISDERAAATVPFGAAWDAILRRVIDRTGDVPRLVVPRHLDGVAARAGHPGLVDRVIEVAAARLMEWALSGAPDVERLLRTLIACAKDMAAAGKSAMMVVALAPQARPLVDRGQVEPLERLGDAMLEVAGDDPEIRAEIEALRGSWLKELREPGRFIDRIGAVPAAWEYGLSAQSRATLWNERANALRLLGRVQEALDMAVKVERLYESIQDAGTSERPA